MLADYFLFPAVLGASGAVVAPVIIHLIMRTKPRRVTFPPIEFVRRTHQANISRHRLKHLILLLMRMLLIVLLSLLIARTVWPDWRPAARGTEPVAAVLVLDNSGSMGYRAKDQSHLVRAKQMARRLVELLPDNSRVAVLGTADPAQRLGFQTSRDRVAALIDAVEITSGDASVAGALNAAGEMLEQVRDISRKEAYLLTDLTAHSWRDGSGTSIRRDKDVQFTVVNLGGQDLNVALGDLRLSSTYVPDNAEITISTAVRRPAQAGQFGVKVEVGGKFVLERALEIPPGREVPQTLTIRAAAGQEGGPPLGDAQGPAAAQAIHGRALLTGLEGDPLEMDNERCFTLMVGPAAQMLQVDDHTATIRPDATSLIMSLAVAPPQTGEVFEHQWVRRTPLTADRLDAAQLAGKNIVLLANVSALTREQWTALKAFVTDGGRLWVVAGPLVVPDEYNIPEAQALIPAELAGLEEMPDATSWQSPRGEGVHPLLEPFLGDANPPLSAVRAQRRFRLKSVAEGARTVLRYEDDVPAILWRDVGEGSVVFWNFSPARGFSNLAGLKQFGVLTQQCLRLLVGARELTYPWGSTVQIPLPRRLGARPEVLIRRPKGEFKPASEDEMGQPAMQAQGGPAQQAGGARGVAIRKADAVGHWEVRARGGGEEFRTGFSVNAPYAESVLKQMEEGDVVAMFPPGRCAIRADLDDRIEGQGAQQYLDLVPPVLLLLLALLTAESFFANRFYRQAAEVFPSRQAER